MNNITYNFEQLIEMAKIEEGLNRQHIYYNKNKPSKKSNFILVPFTAYLEEDEVVVVDGEEVPKIVIDKGMDYYYDPNQFEDVIMFQYARNNQSTVNDYIKALEHYHERDAFLDD